MPAYPRFFVALSLLLLVLTHALALTAVRVRFEWRRAEIARTLCRNRLTPELGCQGSCVLRDELRQAAANTGGLLRLGADTLADLFVPPAVPLALPTTLAVWAPADARPWARARTAALVAGFGADRFRPPAAPIG